MGRFIECIKRIAIERAIRATDRQIEDLIAGYEDINNLDTPRLRSLRTAGNHFRREYKALTGREYKGEQI